MNQHFDGSLPDLTTSIDKLMGMPSPIYYHDTQSERYYVFDKPSQTWLLTTGCPFDPEYKKLQKEQQLDRIEENLNLLLVDKGVLIKQRDDLLAALTISRGQWIHSVNAEQCLAAIEACK